MSAAKTIRETLTNFLTYLLEEEIAVTVNPFAVSDEEVTWHRRPTNGAFLATRSNHSLANYLSWVQNGEYSAILFDGALLQISYTFDGEEVTGHRLAYVPCPFLDTDSVVGYLGIEDLREYYEPQGMNAAQLASVIRFDYDPDAAKPGHPAAHLTLNSADTRIACAGPLSPERFVKFVFKHFYPKLQEVQDYFKGIPNAGHFTENISQDDKSEVHVFWAA